MKVLQTNLSGRVFAIRLFEGEDILESIKEIVKNHNINGGFVKGIGAIRKVTLKFYNSEKKEYELEEFEEDLEVTSLLGNIAWKGDEIIPHIHVNLGKKNKKILGGHLGSPAIVSPTLEIYIFETQDKINRLYNADKNLDLLEL